MRVYLLNPPYFPHFGRGARWQDTGRGDTLYYPVWLSYATAVLEQEHETRLVDAPAWDWTEKEVLTDIKQFQPGLTIVDSSFPSLANDIRVAEALKQACDTTVVMVGPPASQFAARMLASPGVDIVARLEYDLTLLEIARSLEKKAGFSGIAGISYKVDGRIAHNPDREFTTGADLDRMPFVSGVYQRHLRVKDYFLANALHPEVQIFTGRGCPHQCAFCSWPQTLMGRKYRVRSIENVLYEFAWIEKQLPEVKEVVLEDDTFTIDRKRVLEFCEGYRQRKLDIPWSCNARADLDDETMRAMKKANCRLLIVGYESGSDDILKNIRKGITTGMSREFARSARKAGLLVLGDFVIGLPGETRETIAETRQLIKETRPDILQVSVASPFPGTAFYDWCRAGGYLLTDDPDEYLDSGGHQKAIISYPGLANDEMVREVDRILREYYLSLKYLPKVWRQLSTKNGFEEFKRLSMAGRAAFKYFFRSS